MYDKYLILLSSECYAMDHSSLWSLGIHFRSSWSDRSGQITFYSCSRNFIFAKLRCPDTRIPRHHIVCRHPRFIKHALHICFLNLTKSIQCRVSTILFHTVHISVLGVNTGVIVSLTVVIRTHQYSHSVLAGCTLYVCQMSERAHSYHPIYRGFGISWDLTTRR